MLGGISWFAVPFAFASCLGLSARALLHNVRYRMNLTSVYSLMASVLQPAFPTYPNPLSAAQASAGLAAPAAAAVLMGKGGAIAVLLVVLYVPTGLWREAKSNAVPQAWL